MFTKSLTALALASSSALLLTGCTNQLQGTEFRISSASYEGNWPFRPQEVTLLCVNGGTFIKHEGRIYGASGYTSSINDKIPSMMLLENSKAEFNIVDASISFQIHAYNKCQGVGQSVEQEHNK